jgi:hypothetical protein
LIFAKRGQKKNIASLISPLRSACDTDTTELHHCPLPSLWR